MHHHIQLYRWDSLTIYLNMQAFHVTTHYTTCQYPSYDMSSSTKPSIYVFNWFSAANIIYLRVAHHKISAVEIYVGPIILELERVGAQCAPYQYFNKDLIKFARKQQHIFAFKSIISTSQGSITFLHSRASQPRCLSGKWRLKFTAHPITNHNY
jgi:hypothetical protein